MFQINATIIMGFLHTYIHAVSLEGSQISDIPPKRPRFTKII
jgi:hypothetical protein